MFSSVKGVPVKRPMDVTVPQSPNITKKRKTVDEEVRREREGWREGEREREREREREGGRERERREREREGGREREKEKENLLIY